MTRLPLLLALALSTLADSGAAGAQHPRVQELEVVDGAGLRLDGVLVRLHGVRAAWADPAAGAAALALLLEGRDVHCVVVVGGSATGTGPPPLVRCLADGLDVAEPLLAWGHLAAAAGATPAYRRAERFAREMRRGAWGAL